MEVLPRRIRDGSLRAAVAAFLLAVAIWIGSWLHYRVAFLPERARSDRRQLERRAAGILALQLSPERAIANATADGLDAVVEKVEPLDAEPSAFDKMVVISPKHNSTEFMHFRVFVIVYYKGKKPMKIHSDIYGNFF